MKKHGVIVVHRRKQHGLLGRILLGISLSSEIRMLLSSFCEGVGTSHRVL